MIKKILLSGAVLLAMSYSASAQTATAGQAALTGCAAKAHEIQTQIDAAKAQNNTLRVVGLEKALSEVQQHCNDKGLSADRIKKITQKEKKVAERKADLAKATLKGDQDKIAKQTQKLNDAQKELDAAKAALQQ